MEPTPSQRRRIKEMEVMVAEVIVETPDTATLVFFTGNDRLEYKPGHFLTIDPHQFASLERFTAFFEDAKGRKEPPRAYSMCSTPDEKYLAVTVKEERYVSGLTKYPPLLSPMLVRRTVRGMKLVVTGFTGPYTLDDDVASKTDHLVHVCAGSGSVPNFAITKHRARPPPQAPPHVGLLEQNLGRRHLSARARRTGEQVPRPAARDPRADARRACVGVRPEREEGADR